MIPLPFSAVLERPAVTGAWTFLTVPFDVLEVFGARGQVRVCGTINGQAFRSTLRPHGDGRHYLVVNRAMRQAAGVTVGDTVQVTMELDTAERPVDVPPDLAAVLNGNPTAAAAFARMAPSHQREFVAWLEETQNPDTRRRRLSRTVEMLAGRKGPKSSTNGRRGG